VTEFVLRVDHLRQLVDHIFEQVLKVSENLLPKNLWMAHFDGASGDTPQSDKRKPIMSTNYVNSWVEEIPKVSAQIGVSLLPIIEKDLTKLAKDVGSKRFENEFATNNRVDYANEVLLLYSSIRSRSAKVERKKHEDNS
jgi:hypothetical protein